MKITKRQLRRIIKEMLDVDHPADVEAKEGVWAGCEDAGNLELDIDFAKNLNRYLDKSPCWMSAAYVELLEKQYLD